MTRTRHRSRLALALAAGLMIWSLPAAAREAPAPKVARFRVETQVFFDPIPKTVQAIDCWTAIPFADERQKIAGTLIQGPYTPAIAEIPDHRTVCAHIQSPARGGLGMKVTIRFFAERTEDTRSGLEAGSAKPAREEDQTIAQRWLKPDPSGLSDKELQSRASKIVSGEKTPLGKARAIYEYLIANVGLLDRTRDLPGAGQGNLSVTFKAMRGDSLDLAAAFVALCRAAGVPARTVTGWEFPAGSRRGSIEGFHGWAEFHLAGAGWVPVDPADGRRDPARKSYYFGSVDERRLAISIGREVTLIPPQAGPSLNYFINSYWECDGKPMPDPPVEVQFEEVDEIPSSEIQLKKVAPEVTPPPPPSPVPQPGASPPSS